MNLIKVANKQKSDAGLPLFDDRKTFVLDQEGEPSEEQEEEEEEFSDQSKEEMKTPDKKPSSCASFAGPRFASSSAQVSMGTNSSARSARFID